MIRILALSLWTILIPCMAGFGGDKKAAVPMPQRLWSGDAPGSAGQTPVDVPKVTVYLPEKDKANGAAVIICPGGGYGFLAMDHEGHQIARWLNSLGVAGIILQYRIAPRYRHPAPLQDAQRAVRYARAHAARWGIDPKRIGILGFSAGGHLASTAGTHFDAGNPDATDDIDKQSSRPDFMVLVYPVITFKGPHAHMGSRFNLLGKDAADDLVDSLCNDKQVNKTTPPAFLAHTSEDTGVPPENSVAFYLALRKFNIPAELHVYEKGRHGLGLGPKNLPFSTWPARCQAWLDGRGFLTGKN
ncbi:MAG: alpha/beta hydrolase [Planctomycetes bacterium]|nr:alpha/beta hydrolase [Planctomycetota bacterium]